MSTSEAELAPLRILLSNIVTATENFAEKNLLKRGGKADVYKGLLLQSEVGIDVDVVIWKYSGTRTFKFYEEIERISRFKHRNIVSLIGFCDEKDERMIVMEYIVNGSLDKYLSYPMLFTWSQRLHICYGAALALTISNTGKSFKILLDKYWEAKVLICVKSEPENENFDKHSLGVILLEVLYGRKATIRDVNQYLAIMGGEGRHLNQIIAPNLRRQMHWDSLSIFSETAYNCLNEPLHNQSPYMSSVIMRRLKQAFDIQWEHENLSVAFQCLHEKREERPTTGEVVVQLHKALELQEAYEIWEAKLPVNYKDILQYSKSPEIYSTMGKKDIHNKLSKGILLKDDKLWFSIGDNGERNEMIPAKMFSFKSRWLRKWQSIHESRFRKVAEMLDISNLNIQIKITPQLLPSNVKYSVHLVFKFHGPRKSHAKRMYVNLKYKMGGENLHAYFATWREDNWMMIELCRFSNREKEANFEVLLEGFSRCYCDSRAVYIEGVEFRAIDKVKQEKTGKLKDVQQVLKSSEKVYHMESAKEVVYDSTNVTLFNSKSSTEFSDEGLYEVPQQAKLSIKWYRNEYQKMPPNTKIACYLVYKLSENCHGLHCPVIVRDQFHWKSKEIVYFRLPSPWNMHDTDYVPESRRDGWVEVIVSKFNSDFVLKKDCLLGKLKLVSYEGTMSGLIIRGLEFRPIL